MRFRAHFLIVFLALCVPILQGGVLRDQVVFKEGVTLPSFAKATRIECEILSESEDKVRINLSPLKGISDIREIARGDIQEIIRGDRSDLEWETLKAKWVLPNRSQPVEYYNKAVEGELSAFLARHQGKPVAEEAGKLARAFSLEGKMVAAGWSRLGSRWFSPTESESMRAVEELEALLEKLDTIQRDVLEDRFQSLIGLDEEILRFKQSVYYPDLVDGLKIIVAPARDSCPASLRSIAALPVSNMRTQIGIFVEARKVLEPMHQNEDFEHRTWMEQMTKLNNAAAVIPDLSEFHQFMLKDKNAILGGLVMLAYRKVRERESSFESAATVLDSMCSRLNLPVEQKNDYRLKIDELRRFKAQLEKLLDIQDYPGIAELVPPVPEIPMVRKARAALREEAERRMAQSRPLIENIRKAVKDGRYEEAVEPARTRAGIWPNDPEAEVLKTELLATFQKLINGKKKEDGARLFQVLKAGWGGDGQVVDAEKNVEYGRSVSMLDNMSGAMLLAIGFSALLAIVILRAAVKYFAAGE
ncbi:MAG: hypothetical protein SFU85_05465 [Candidatus Methylacidiphilales bacterium]|nr:hypothetical protein [Candidatus Methylacidiphilales bacterium]